MDKIKKKVFVVGEATVGKTTLVQLFCSTGSEFQRDYQMTHIADITTRIIELESFKDIELIFFDIGGKDFYRDASSKLLKLADLCVMVYDCTNEASFEAIKTWSDLIKKENNRLPQGLLVCNKIDLESMRKVKAEAGLALSKTLNLEYCETTFREYDNIEESFAGLAKMVGGN